MVLESSLHFASPLPQHVPRYCSARSWLIQGHGYGDITLQRLLLVGWRRGFGSYGTKIKSGKGLLAPPIDFRWFGAGCCFLGVSHRVVGVAMWYEAPASA